MSHNPSSSVILTKKYIITPKVLVYESFISYTHLRLAANLRMTLNTSSSCLHPLRAKSFFILSTSSSHLVFFGVFFFFSIWKKELFFVWYIHMLIRMCANAVKKSVSGVSTASYILFFFTRFFHLLWGDPFSSCPEYQGLPYHISPALQLQVWHYTSLIFF